MSDLTEFLLARIAEDEAVARAAIGTAALARQSGRWSFETVAEHGWLIPIIFAVTDSGAKTQVANMEAAWEREERGAHIARHDPARVLAECEAKRHLLDEALVWGEGCLDVMARYMAEVYAAHPDYDQTWRP